MKRASEVPPDVDWFGFILTTFLIDFSIKNNIPVIFYFSGTHEDYHMPTDTPDKIRYDLLTKRTKLIFHTAWEIANMDDKIVVD